MTKGQTGKSGRVEEVLLITVSLLHFTHGYCDPFFPFCPLAPSADKKAGVDLAEEACLPTEVAGREDEEAATGKWV